MPTKLKIVFVLLVLGLGSSYLQETWFGVGFYVFCMIGLLRGTEAARNLLLLSGYTGVLFSSVPLYLLIRSSISEFSLGSLWSVSVVGGFIYYGFSLAINCCLIYVLRVVEVQDWLLMRSLGESD